MVRTLLGCRAAFVDVGFKCVRLIAIALLFASSPSGAEILIGQSIPRSGALAPFGEAIIKGTQAYVDRVNASGGIRGQKIQIVTLDDGGDSKRTVLNAQKLIAQGVIALYGSIEGGPCSALLPVVIESHVPLVACMAGAPQLRTPFNPYVFPVRAAHLSEFDELLRYAARNGIDRLAFVHSDSDTGRMHLANVTRLAKQHNVGVVAAIAFGAKPDIEDIARQIVGARATAVLNHGGYAMYASLLKTVRAAGSTATFLAVNSGGQQLAQLMGTSAEGVVMSQVVPYPWSRATKIQRDYQDDLRRLDANEPFGFSSMEGYLSARLLVEGLRRTDGKPTRDRLRAALEKLGRLELGGYELSYAPGQHEGSRFVDVTRIHGDGTFLR